MCRSQVLTSVVSTFARWSTQPQRGMCRLHGVLDYGQEMIAEVGEIDFLTEGGGEAIEGANRVVFVSVKAAVDQSLDAAAQGLEECGDHERGGDEGGLRIFGEVA